MSMKFLITTVLAASALAVAVCGGDDDDESPSPPDGTAPEQSSAGGDKGDRPGGAGGVDQGGGGGGGAAGVPGTTIKIAESDYGPILFDESNQAIYLFDKEQGSRSKCYGACAEAWPPVLTEGDPRGAGPDSKLLGTTERDDGSTQVTYGGHPLYYYAHEEPGQVLCHDVEEFGGLWLAVTPEGSAAA
jgi:predicted lipoprotein with Yx(FWY)xxD motif